MQAFVIGPFVAEGLSLDISYTVSGVSLVTPAAGFVDAALRRCGLPAQNPLFAVVLHDAQERSGQFRPQPTRPDKGKSKLSEAPEGAEGCIEASVVVIDTTQKMETDQLERAVQPLRFAGAPIRGRNGAPVRVKPADTVVEAFDAVRPGRVIADRTDLLEQNLADAQDPLDAWLSAFVSKRDADGNWVNDHARPDQTTTRYLIPLAIGYQALEPVAEAEPRYGARDAETPHVFAEPVATIGELLSPRRISREGDATPALWRWQVENDANLIRLAGHSTDQV